MVRPSILFHLRKVSREKVVFEHDAVVDQILERSSVRSIPKRGVEDLHAELNDLLEIDRSDVHSIPTEKVLSLIDFHRRSRITLEVLRGTNDRGAIPLKLESVVTETLLAELATLKEVYRTGMRPKRVTVTQTLVADRENTPLLFEVARENHEELGLDVVRLNHPAPEGADIFLDLFGRQFMGSETNPVQLNQVGAISMIRHPELKKPDRIGLIRPSLELLFVELILNEIWITIYNTHDEYNLSKKVKPRVGSLL